MKATSVLAGGLAGACALTLLHETARRIDPDAPRADLLGMNAISNLLKGFDKSPPPENKLFLWTLAGDLAGNALYYSLAGTGSKNEVWERGVLLGLAAGAGAVILPKPLGLNDAPTNRKTKTKIMTVAWYLAGALVASATMSLLGKEFKK